MPPNYFENITFKFLGNFTAAVACYHLLLMASTLDNEPETHVAAWRFLHLAHYEPMAIPEDKAEVHYVKKANSHRK